MHYNYASVLLLGMIIYNIINIFFLRELARRFGFFKISRRDYYECGFRPQTQRPVRLPTQFLIICLLFLLYDIELIFLFPYVAGIATAALTDFILIFLFFGLLIISLVVDYRRHALLWQY